MLSAFHSSETLELVRSVFGDAPNVERFSDWLHGRAAGGPLYTIEITRQLVAKHVVQYSGGVWILPVDRPDTALPAALEDALSLRIQSLSGEARALAECLSLQDQEPSLELCRLLVGADDERAALLLLDELARNDVLNTDRDGYRFSSTALREALLSGMAGARRERNHRRLGEAFAKLAGNEDAVLRVEAGFHLIRGADELRGADLIASVTHDAVTARSCIANLHHLGKPLEAALNVYKAHRRSSYERMPLLAALAHAGYYEDRMWGERYGDDALDLLEDMSGLRYGAAAASGLRTLVESRIRCGRRLDPFPARAKRERPYSYAKVLVQLFGAVTTLTGAASRRSTSSGQRRGWRTMLEPFSVLPERLTPVGIYRILQGSSRDRTGTRSARVPGLRDAAPALQNPRYYPSLPADAGRSTSPPRILPGARSRLFRADGRAALESADALDASGMKLYSVIGGQLRFLYYMNRGEFTKAAPHRQQVELYAAQVGSAWQVEIWEAPALLLIHTTLTDVVACTRLSKRLELIGETVPALRLYARLAPEGLRLITNDSLLEAKAAVAAILEGRAPRSFIGWAAAHAYVAWGCNDLGEYERASGRDGMLWFNEAKASCEPVLALMMDDDRGTSRCSSSWTIGHARATAALGDVAGALSRIDGLLARFQTSDHPLVHGLLHEARARIAWAAGRTDEYARSAEEVERWFRPTETPALIADTKG